MSAFLPQSNRGFKVDYFLFQILNNQLELSAKSKDDLYQQLDKYKKENDELLFQLEERNIELEGTRAQVRVLEKYQHHPKPETISRKVESSKSEENFTFLENDHLRSKGFSESEINRARQIFLESQSKKVDKSEIVKILNRTKNASPQRQNDLNNSFDLDKTGSVIPTMALPWPIMASHQSSGTESTQALEISSELEADMARVDKCDSMRNEKSPYKRRPSKIPLNIQKTSKSLKSVTSESGSSYLKKSDGDLNRSKDLNISLKKCSLDNSNISVMSRSPPQNPTSIRYSSVGRTGSQLSMASQKSQTQSTVASKSDKRKSLTNGAQREESSLSSTKNPSLKQTTNFSSVRQRDTLTRKGQNDSWDGHGKKTLRTSLRDSFRSKVSNDGTQSAGKKEGSLTGVRKDSVQQRQARPNPSQQQKTNISKTIMSTDGDSTKVRPAKLSFLSSWLKF
ncbi:hypothetical protein RUM44_004506 [Polyplax serrata]|uniref:Uncharacterized protein n=1 Tax=Polyplax serrata TaxID=468196 RepID=A0ABR1B321_POLSC